MRKAKADASVVLPARLECMRPYFTAEVVTAAMERLILRTKLPESFDNAQRKLALILVRELNPDECIEQGEEVVLRGIAKADTLKGYKDEGHYPRFVNGTLPRKG